MPIKKQIRTVGLMVNFAILSGCSSFANHGASEINANPSYVIHNPETFATHRTLVDDDGNSMSVRDAFPWASGTSRVAD